MHVKTKDCYRTSDISIHCEEDNAIMKLFTDYNTKEMGPPSLMSRPSRPTRPTVSHYTGRLLKVTEFQLPSVFLLLKPYKPRLRDYETCQATRPTP